MCITTEITKNLTAKLVWMLVVISSTFFPAVSLNHERVYAQDSPSTTNATVLTGNDAGSQWKTTKSIH